MIVDFTGTQREIILRYGIDGASSVLDVGCGDGEKTFYISPHVQWSVGIDPDENIIKFDDFYEHYVISKSKAKWGENKKQDGKNSLRP